MINSSLVHTRVSTEARYSPTYTERYLKWYLKDMSKKAIFWCRIGLTGRFSEFLKTLFSGAFTLSDIYASASTACKMQATRQILSFVQYWLGSVDRQLSLNCGPGIGHEMQAHGVSSRDLHAMMLYDFQGWHFSSWKSSSNLCCIWQSNRQ